MAERRFEAPAQKREAVRQLPVLERSGDVEGVFIPELSEEHAPELLLQHMVATFKAPASLPVGADRDRAEPSSGATVKGVGR